jgi:hypothetical protein
MLKSRIVIVLFLFLVIIVSSLLIFWSHEDVIFLRIPSDFESEYRLNFSELTAEERSNYLVFCPCSYDKVKISNTSFLDAKEPNGTYKKYYNEPKLLHTILDPGKKVLFYDFGVRSALLFTFLAREQGYDAYFTVIRQDVNLDLMDGVFIEEFGRNQSIPVHTRSAPLNQSLVILFEEPYEYVKNEFGFTPDKIIFFRPSISNEIKDLSELMNVHCFNALNCLLTQLFLTSCNAEVEEITYIHSEF